MRAAVTSWEALPNNCVVMSPFGESSFRAWIKRDFKFERFIKGDYIMYSRLV